MTPSIIGAANFIPASLDPIRDVLPAEEFELLKKLVPELQHHFQAIYGKCDSHYEQYAEWVEKNGTEEQKKLFRRSQKPDFKGLIRPDLISSDSACADMRKKYQEHLDRYSLSLSEGTKPNERFLLALTHLADAGSSYARIGALEHGIGEDRQNIAFLETSLAKVDEKSGLSADRQKALSVILLAFHERTHGMDLSTQTTLPLCDGITMGQNLEGVRLAVGEGLALVGSLIGSLKLKESGWLDERDLAHVFDKALQTMVARYLPPEKLVDESGRLSASISTAFPHAVGEMIFLHEADKKGLIKTEESEITGRSFSCPAEGDLQKVLWDAFCQIVDFMVYPRKNQLDAYYAQERRRESLYDLSQKWASYYKRVTPPFDYLNVDRGRHTSS